MTIFRENIKLLKLYLLLIVAFTAFLSPTLSSAEQFRKDTVEVVSTSADLGLLPESVNEKVDSVFTNKFANYYKLSGKHHVIKSSDTNAVLPDSVYIKRLGALPSEIILSYNSVVKECIETYINKRRTLVASMLPKTGIYFPMIEEVFDKYGLPLELKYLAIVESNLNPLAVSRRGATGLWQFMLSTGKLYGLDVNSLIDERRDPKRATEAAARYFLDMHKIYDDWLTTIASYNCGPGNVNKAISRANGSTKFWDIFPYLPRETRAYVPFFIAAYYSMEYYKDHGIIPYSLSFPYATDTIHISHRSSFDELSKLTGVDEETLKTLNPKYKKDIIPGRYGKEGIQVVNIPSNAVSLFAKQLEASKHRSNPFAPIKEQDGEENDDSGYKIIRHKVTINETIDAIARKYSVSSSEIKTWNKLKTDVVRQGSIVIVKVPEDASTNRIMGVDLTEPAKRNTSYTHSRSGKKYYTVRRGDTLGAIAKRYKGVSISAIKRANGIKGHIIRPGQKLIIP